MRTNYLGVIGEISSLPGCSQVAVSHGVFVPFDKRGRGLGDRAHKARLRQMFEELGYDYILCTVDMDNKAQCRILEKNAWDRLCIFKSEKTQHAVGLYGKSKRSRRWSW